MKIQIDNITLTPDKQSGKDLINHISDKHGISKITGLQIIRKSLDARKKDNILYRYRVACDVPDSEAEGLLQNKDISEYEPINFPEPIKSNSNLEVIIVGAGPAGLFSALRLIRAGVRVTILERGKPVEERMKDISILEGNGTLNEESNVLFGEGGAGTYSDGKLTTRTKKDETLWFLNEMVKHGASEEIKYEAKPHVGTDRLRQIIISIRKTIIDSGSSILFNERVTDLILQNSIIKGVITSSGNEYRADSVVLAAGHSARDLYELLNSRKIALEKKGFAIGVRVEHPADLINSIQYGKSKYRDNLPTAEYILTHNNKKTGRGVYSFCMCPGGSVINSSSEEGKLCVNGMSLSKRNSPWSNSAIVVSVKQDDVGDDILSGIELQREIERNAFIAGGGGFLAPAQRITSLLKNRLDNSITGTSYRPGVSPSKISDYLPPWISEEIKNAMEVFDRKMKGFISESAILIGAETRTSSPLRICRDENLQSISVEGLFPTGEGAGYSGGIVSSAVDGIRAADSILLKFRE